MDYSFVSFAPLSIKILPLYLVIGLGYLAGRKLEIGLRPVAQLAIYVISPVFAFGFLAQSDIAISHLFVPVLWFAISFFMRGLSLILARTLWKDGTAYLFSAGLSVGNTGFLGVPVALAIFDPMTAALFVVAQIADFIFGSTVLYYTVARGKYSVYESVVRLLRLPPFYAVIAGLLYSFLGMPSLPESVTTMTEAFKGCYVVLGMLMVGLALAEIKSFDIDFKFLLFGNAYRLIAWPVLVFGLVVIDAFFIGWMDDSVRKIMVLYAALPIATNTVVFASELGLHPEKAATLVVSSTFLSLLSIPLFCAMFL